MGEKDRYVVYSRISDSSMTLYSIIEPGDPWRVVVPEGLLWGVDAYVVCERMNREAESERPAPGAVEADE